MLSIFSCASWPSVCLLWRNIYLGHLPIFRWGCLVFWYWTAWAGIFWRLIPSVALFASIFSHSVGCLFILFMVSFAVQKLLSLFRSHLFTFVFISITLGGGLQEILLRFMSLSVLPMFSCKSFIVSSLTFRSLIHFEFILCIFVYGVRGCSKVSPLHRNEFCSESAFVSPVCL